MARALMAEALAPRTRAAYAWAWEHFTQWCLVHHRRSLPASPETVAAWITARVSGYEGRIWSKQSLALVLAAIAHVHAATGYRFDRGHPALMAVWKGATRRLALVRAERQAAPLMAADLKSLVEGLTNTPRDVRDRALLLVGWAAALRQDELVQLDWHARGEGRGVLNLERWALVITLLRSKARQDGAERLRLGRAHMPSAFAAVRAWCDCANLRPHEPVWRPIDRHGTIGAKPLTGRSVTRILQARVEAFFEGRGMDKTQARRDAQAFSGHSLRSGFISSAAEEGLPAHAIAQHSRHRSQRALARYIRGQDRATVIGRVGF